MNKVIDYEQDFYSWALHHAQLLREGRFAELDIEHLAEELEDIGKNDRRALENRCIILIAHLLKWEYQPSHRGSSWKRSIDEQRLRIDRLIRKNPSLKPYLSAAVADVYLDAVKLAAQETQIPASQFPQECLYSIEQMQDEKFYPNN